MKIIFEEAESVFKAICAMKQTGELDASIAPRCYKAILTYMNLTLSALGLENVGNIVDAYCILQDNNIDISQLTYANCAIFEAVGNTARELRREDIYQMTCAFINVRRSVLDYLVDKFPPRYANGFCCHDVTGVYCKSEEYDVTSTLSEYYGI